MNQWQKNGTNVSAILLPFDELAYFVLDECDKRSIRVPEDLSIMSLGDWVPSSIGRISLSSVAEDLEKMGRKAAQLMLKMVDGEEPDKQKFLYPGEVKLRGTTRAI